MAYLFDEITIRIRPVEGTVTVEEHTGNVVSVKNISHDDLLKCIEKGMKESKTVFSGFLPDNCVSYDVCDRHKTITLWIPPGHIDLTYHKTTYEKFPLPAMVFSISVSAGGKTSNHRMAVIADEKPTPKTPLFAYPFSNVYYDSRICVGAANSLPAYKEVRTLETLPYHLLRLPNNDHMFSQHNNKLNLPYRDLLELLKDKDPSFYYNDILIPMNASLQDFIDGRIKNKGAYQNAA
jgi:hypothetical protein